MYIYVEETNKYYRGFGEAKSTEYSNIQCNSIPNQSDETKIKFYKLVETVHRTETTTNMIDTNGVMQTYKSYIPTKIYNWELDEDAYAQYLTDNGETAPETTSDKIAAMQTKIATLATANATTNMKITAINSTVSLHKDCIVELSNKVFAEAGSYTDDIVVSHDTTK